MRSAVGMLELDSQVLAAASAGAWLSAPDPTSMANGHDRHLCRLGRKERSSRTDLPWMPPSTIWEAESHVGTSLIPEAEQLLQVGIGCAAQAGHYKSCGDAMTLDV